MGADSITRPAPPAWVRRTRTGPFERAAGTLCGTGRRNQYANRELHNRSTIFSSSPQAGIAFENRSAAVDRDDSEKFAPPSAGCFTASRAVERQLATGAG